MTFPDRPGKLSKAELQEHQQRLEKVTPKAMREIKETSAELFDLLDAPEQAATVKDHKDDLHLVVEHLLKTKEAVDARYEGEGKPRSYVENLVYYKQLLKSLEKVKHRLSLLEHMDLSEKQLGEVELTGHADSYTTPPLQKLLFTDTEPFEEIETAPRKLTIYNLDTEDTFPLVDKKNKPTGLDLSSGSQDLYLEQEGEAARLGTLTLTSEGALSVDFSAIDADKVTPEQFPLKLNFELHGQGHGAEGKKDTVYGKKQAYLVVHPNGIYETKRTGTIDKAVDDMASVKLKKHLDKLLQEKGGEVVTDIFSTLLASHPSTKKIRSKLSSNEQEHAIGKIIYTDSDPYPALSYHNLLGSELLLDNIKINVKKQIEKEGIKDTIGIKTVVLDHIEGLLSATEKGDTTTIKNLVENDISTFINQHFKEADGKQSLAEYLLQYRIDGLADPDRAKEMPFERWNDFLLSPEGQDIQKELKEMFYEPGTERLNEKIISDFKTAFDKAFTEHPEKKIRKEWNSLPETYKKKFCEAMLFDTSKIDWKHGIPVKGFGTGIFDFNEFKKLFRDYLQDKLGDLKNRADHKDTMISAAHLWSTEGDITDELTDRIREYIDNDTSTTKTNLFNELNKMIKDGDLSISSKVEETASVSDVEQIHRAHLERQIAEEMREDFRDANVLQKARYFLARKTILQNRIENRLRHGGVHRDEQSSQGAARHEFEADYLESGAEQREDLDEASQEMVDELVDEYLGSAPDRDGSIDEMEFRSEFSRIVQSSDSVDDIDHMGSNILFKLDRFKDRQRMITTIQKAVNESIRTDDDEAFRAKVKEAIDKFYANYTSHPDFLKMLDVDIDTSKPEFFDRLKLFETHQKGLTKIAAQTYKVRVQILTEGQEAYDVSDENKTMIEKIGRFLDDPTIGGTKLSEMKGGHKIWKYAWGCLKPVATVGAIAGGAAAAGGTIPAVMGSAFLVIGAKTFLYKQGHYWKEQRDYKRNQANNILLNEKERREIEAAFDKLSNWQKSDLYFWADKETKRTRKLYKDYIRTTHDQLENTDALATDILSLANKSRLSPEQQSRLRSELAKAWARLQLKEQHGENFLGSASAAESDKDLAKLGQALEQGMLALGYARADIADRLEDLETESAYQAEQNRVLQSSGHRQNEIGYNEARSRYVKRRNRKSVRSGLITGTISGAVAGSINRLGEALFGSGGGEAASSGAESTIQEPEISTETSEAFDSDTQEFELGEYEHTEFEDLDYDLLQEMSKTGNLETIPADAEVHTEIAVGVSEENADPAKFMAKLEDITSQLEELRDSGNFNDATVQQINEALTTEKASIIEYGEAAYDDGNPELLATRYLEGVKTTLESMQQTNPDYGSIDINFERNQDASSTEERVFKGLLTTEKEVVVTPSGEAPAPTETAPKENWRIPVWAFDNEFKPTDKETLRQKPSYLAEQTESDEDTTAADDSEPTIRTRRGPRK